MVLLPDADTPRVMIRMRFGRSDIGKGQVEIIKKIVLGFSLLFFS